MLRNSLSTPTIAGDRVISSARPHTWFDSHVGHLLEPNVAVQLLAHHYVLREYLR